MTQNMTIKMMKMWNLQLRVASACSAFDDCLEFRSRNPDPCRYTPIQGLIAHALGSLWLQSRHVIDSLLQNMLPTTVHNQKDPPLCSSKGIHCVPFLRSVSSSSGMDPNRFEPACAHVAAIAISCHIQEAPYERMENHDPMAIDGLWLVSQEQPQLGVHGRFGIRLESNRRVHSTPAQLRKALEQNDATWCKDMQNIHKMSRKVLSCELLHKLYNAIYTCTLWHDAHYRETMRNRTALCGNILYLQNFPWFAELASNLHRGLHRFPGAQRFAQCMRALQMSRDFTGWMTRIWLKSWRCVACFCFRCAKKMKKSSGPSWRAGHDSNRARSLTSCSLSEHVWTLSMKPPLEHWWRNSMGEPND